MLYVRHHQLIELEIIPYERFGPVEFGMIRPEVADVLGPPDHVLSSDMSYHYAGLGNLGFDAAGRCDWLGSFPGRVTAVVEGVHLAGGFDQIIGRLTAAGYQVLHGRPDWVDFGFSYCDELGILIGREGPHSEPQKVDAVAAWGRGYWERQRPEARSVVPGK